MNNQRVPSGTTEESPIIFSGWSIRRILAGEKTQTRRIVKPQPKDGVQTIHHDGDRWYAGTMNSEWDPVLWEKKCPFGKSGDEIWVREAFRLPSFAEDTTPSEFADSFSNVECNPPVLFPADDHAGEADGEWGRKRPSIHMPRELCRLRLRVEDVRVERVQEISLGDAAAEGCDGLTAIGEELPEGQKDFRKLWNDIHGTGAWEENPHVWVVEFSRIDSE
jgi:hypothetical protein